MQITLLDRYRENPILKPEPSHPWESYAVFNGSIIKKDEEYNLFYRAMGEEQVYNTKKMRLSTIGKATSSDGVKFQNREPFIVPEYIWEKYGCEDPRVVRIEDTFLIFYTALANYPPDYKGIKIAVAVSRDLQTISEKHLITPFNAKAMAMFPEKINNLYTVILTVDTDRPPSHIAIAQFKKLEDLWSMDYWQQWHENLESNLIHLRRVNSDQIEIGAVPLKTDSGWILIYSYIKHYLSGDIKKQFRIEAALLDLKNPQKIVGRIEKPLLVPEAEYELKGQGNNIVFPESAIIEENQLKIYYGAADSVCAMATTDMRIFMSNFEVNAPATIKCQKFANNPLLEAIGEHDWESISVSNPAALEINDVTYIVYRAMSPDNISRLGLAISQDGMVIDERLTDPIYPLRSEYEKPKNPGKGGGCEDPRITLIDNKIYMCYTAYDGQLPRLAMTSIEIKDFLNRNWSVWAEPKIISPPDIADKDGALFPEKVYGKYVFFHRIEPNVIIDTVDDLEFKNKSFLGSKGIVAPLTGTWDSVKIGVNNPPLKTELGWLVFYHGISEIDRHYRLGAFLLDLNNITQVIGRTPYPILEPETSFERVGVVNNVVFPCGHVLKNDEIFLYYGGADKVVCGARVSLSELLNYLKKSSEKKYLEF